MNKRIAGMQTVFLIIVLALIGGGGYLMFQNPDFLQASARIKTGEIDAKIVPLRKLKDVHFDTAIFEEPAYQKFKEPEMPRLIPVKPGRENPFLPPRLEVSIGTSTNP